MPDFKVGSLKPCAWASVQSHEGLAHYMHGVLRGRGQRTVLVNTVAYMCVHTRQDLATLKGKAWPTCDLCSPSSIACWASSKIRILHGISFWGVCCFSYILNIEEKSHHYGAAFLVFLFSLRIYCGKERTTSESPGKLFQTRHAFLGSLRFWSGPRLRTTHLAYPSPRPTISTSPLITKASSFFL